MRTGPCVKDGIATVSVMPHGVHTCLCVGVCVKDRVVSFGVAERHAMFMSALAGVSVKDRELRWLRHGVATLGVRERTAARASLGGHHGTQKIGSGCNGSLR